MIALDQSTDGYAWIMKKAISIILMIMTIASSVISYTVEAAQEPWVFSDSRGIYSVSFSGKNATVTSFGTYDVTADLRLEYSIDTVCAADNKVVMFCNDPVNDQLVVTVYDISYDTLDSFALNGRLVYTGDCCCCDRDYIYIENDNRLEQYTYYGSYKRSFSFPDYVAYTASGYDSGIYAVCADDLYYISGGSMSLISGADASSPILPVCDDVILSGSGRVQIVSGDQVTSSVKTDARADAGIACVIGSMLYYPSGSVIYGCDIDTGKTICSYQCSQSVRYLYADGNTIYALDSGLMQIASPDSGSFTYKQDPSDNGGNNNGSGGNSNNSSKGSNNTDGQIPDGMPTISSDVYEVSYDDYIISRVPAGTTIAKFKSNIDYSGCSVRFYRSEVEKTSGNVGTAMMADFIKGSDVLRFELSVIGDLTGEGSANSRDLNILLDSFIGSADFNGSYALSADINNDGTVDIIDAAKLKRSY